MLLLQKEIQNKMEQENVKIQTNKEKKIRQSVNITYYITVYFSDDATK